MKDTRSIKGLSLAAFAAALSLAAFASKIDVTAGGTYDLSDASNLSANTLAFAGDATVKLNGAVADGVFELKAALLFEGAGTVTFDISALEGCTKILSRRHVRDNGLGGTLAFPAGVTEFRLGAAVRGAPGDISFPSFEADATFVEAGGKVVFENDATVVRLPTSAPWEAVTGSRLSVFGTNVFGSGDYTLGNFDVQAGSVSCFASGATITVPPGRTFLVRICQLNSTPATGNLSSWQGLNGQVVPFNVHLGGEGAVFTLLNNSTHTYTGNVTGTGTVALSAGQETTLGGNVAFEGAFASCTGSENSESKIHLRKTGEAPYAYPDFNLVRSRGPAVCLEPPGAGTADVTASVASFYSSTQAAYPTKIVAAAHETVAIGTLGGNVCATGAGAGAKIVIDSLASGATLWVESGVEVTVKTAAANAKIVFKSDGEKKSWTFNGPETGAALAPTLEFDVADGELALGGKVKVAETLPVATLVVAADADVRATVPDGAKIVSKGGALKAPDWRDRVLQWNDAMAESSFNYAKASLPGQLGLDPAGASVGYLNKYLADDQIVDWLDCRSEFQGHRFRVIRYDPDGTQGSGLGDNANSYTLFPARKVIDGKPALVCTKANTRSRIWTATGISDNGYSGRVPLNVKCAVFVFNGSEGGGNALFTSAGNTFLRLGNLTTSQTLAEYPTVDSPIVYNNVKNLSFRKNGEDVDCTTTGLDTGWQVLSFTCSSAVSISGIGPAQDHSSYIDSAKSNGGQIFGEIIFFEDVPTADEILDIEKYLADKWGVPIAHSGSTVTKTQALFGTGTVALEAHTELAGGNFAGTLDLNGRNLTFERGLLPFTAADIPSENRVVWFDPSLPGAVEVGEDPAKPDELTYLRSRDNDGVLTGDGSAIVFSPYSASCDRRPRVVTSERANGPALPWLEFANGSADDHYGNFLYFAKLPYQPMANYTDSTPKVDVPAIKAGFFVLDTTQGGGTVVSSTAGGADPLASRSNWPLDNTVPIFNDKCSKDVKAANAWLDGVRIRPDERPYSFRPEVFAFSLQDDAKAVAAKIVGYFLKSGEHDTPNPEVIGEFLFYSSTVSDGTADRITAYLMNKWLGKLPKDYTDYRGMTVTGKGTLTVEDIAFMPKFGAGFVGTVELPNTGLAFTLQDDGTVRGGLDFAGGALSLPASVTINVSANRPAMGVYPLVKFGSLASGTTFTLAQASDRMSLETRADGLYLRCTKPGLILIVR